MKNTRTTLAVPSFRGPREKEWRPLAAEPDNENGAKVAKSNREELHNALLASLQMQHLTVLSGSGCSLSADGPSMADLWREAVGEPATDNAKAIASAVGHDLNDKNIETLLSRVEISLQLKNDDSLSKFLSGSKQIILDRCTSFLSSNRLEAHRTFLHRLSRRRARDQRLKVFTTNYDLCFERAAGVLGAVVLDGFSFIAPRFYDPRFFSYDIVRRPRGDDGASYLEGVFLLYKLHGSVNWARKSNGSIQEEASPSPDEACLIYPAAGKYQQSFTQPHLESMAQYLAAVREPNTCLVAVGFGFNDDHLTEPLLTAITSNPHLRVIVVDPNTDDNLNGENRRWQRLSQLSAQGEDVWFIAADFGQFAQLIPDLKSLTPAESLMKAIQGAARPV